MRIVHIITGLNDGGAEAVLYRLCVHDPKNRHTVISLMDAGKYGSLLEKAGIDTHYLLMPRGRIKLSALFKMWRILRIIRPDIVQTWMYHADLIGGIVARLACIRNICWGVHHSNLDGEKSRRSTIFTAHICAELSAYIPSRIIFCSQKSAIIHENMGYNSNLFSIIPNGYNVFEFHPMIRERIRLRTEWGINGDTPLIGMVARYNPQKDHENLLKALRLVANTGQIFKCVLVGSGVDSTNERLLMSIHACGLDDKVMMIGHRNDISSIMNALDIHVLSSRYGEAFPNVIAEAMACGTPCVTTDVGDAELIVGNTGWVVRPGDHYTLAQILSTALFALKDQECWVCRQKASRQRIIENFSIKRMIENYDGLWEKFLPLSQ